jgi:hypothetical protein
MLPLVKPSPPPLSVALASRSDIRGNNALLASLNFVSFGDLNTTTSCTTERAEGEEYNETGCHRRENVERYRDRGEGGIEGNEMGRDRERGRGSQDVVVMCQVKVGQSQHTSSSDTEAVSTPYGSHLRNCSAVPFTWIHSVRDMLPPALLLRAPVPAPALVLPTPALAPVPVPVF